MPPITCYLLMPVSSAAICAMICLIFFFFFFSSLRYRLLPSSCRHYFTICRLERVLYIREISQRIEMLRTAGSAPTLLFAYAAFTPFYATRHYAELPRDIFAATPRHLRYALTPCYFLHAISPPLFAAYAITFHVYAIAAAAFFTAAIRH